MLWLPRQARVRVRNYKNTETQNVRLVSDEHEREEPLLRLFSSSALNSRRRYCATKCCLPKSVRRCRQLPDSKKSPNIQAQNCLEIHAMRNPAYGM
jgi:hypothetical protein